MKSVEYRFQIVGFHLFLYRCAVLRHGVLAEMHYFGGLFQAEREE